MNQGGFAGDMWASGLCLYQASVGKHPFAAATPMAMFEVCCQTQLLLLLIMNTINIGDFKS